MTKEEIFDKVKETLIENLDLENPQISLESNLQEDLDATSLELVDLAMDLEKALNTRIELEELTDIATVGDVVELILNKHKS